jgi:hypothetical protein
MEWKAIESAPRDGTWVLLFCTNIGNDYDERDYDVKNAPLITVGNFDAADRQGAQWLSVETYTEVHDYGGWTGVCESTYRLVCSPTHWCELPDPPA